MTRSSQARAASLSPAALAFGPLAPRRKNKFGAKRVTVAGEAFDSQAEAKRYDVLRLMERAGEIGAIKRQVRYRLEVNGVHVCDYVADFVYRARGDERDTVEDCKGFRTPAYKLKAKLMLACHGVAILETGTENGRRRGKRRRPQAAKSRSSQGGQNA